MKTKLSLAVAAAFVIGARIAAAQGFTPPTFAGLDTDKNNSLSKAEVAAFVKTIPAGQNPAPNADDVFARWDANKDGSVSQAEFDARPRPAGGGGPPGAGGGAPPPR
jgi:Ca2+-binding EF-hand superfamily protein